MPVNIRVLASDENRRGDIYSRLMEDLFVSLGYDNVRHNISRSGREIDIEAEHRFEKRRALAECKIVASKVGGRDINTFVGALRAERQKGPFTAYFISLAGFTETSIDQETEAGAEGVILVDGGRVVAELVRGHILASLERATEQAGQCVAGTLALSLDEEVDLLAHDRGWTWAIYYLQGRARTHVVLVHADGAPLAAGVASSIVDLDRQAGGDLHRLTCLNPTPSLAASDGDGGAAAFRQYFAYLNAECGYISLDGLPPDADVGTLRLRLENLFVPLGLHMIGAEGHPGVNEVRVPTGRAMPVGQVLAQHSRLTILASPGGGKSTLLKRLAVAYADPERRLLADDQLPERPWIPLFVRCRELREKARAPFSEIVEVIASRAFLAEHAAGFRRRIGDALRDGSALLLIDGLDEIADAGDRAAFVRTLRALLSVYPTANVVITSRESGFRHVASLLVSMCVQYRLAEFGNSEIKSVVDAWYREVIGDRPAVKAEASRLAATICANDRIRRLAVNPLLVTTLLLVKRWVGQLPTRRSVLYGKAVEVLLATWNVEGHEPIDQDEGLPQLCFVAASMMQNGVQRIRRQDLVALLRQAREQLSEELAFARIGVSEFIERIEQRSSLLIMSGVDIVDGTLSEFYEFRHLTFQEYLTAMGLVEGWYPNRSHDDVVERLLMRYVGEAGWEEVIPLAAVLSGRKAENFIRELIGELIQPTRERVELLALSRCLEDEVQITPDTARRAARVLLDSPGVLLLSSFGEAIGRGKYGGVLREELWNRFAAEAEARAGSLDVLAYASCVGRVVAGQVVGEAAGREIGTLGEEEIGRCVGALRSLLESSEGRRRCEGAVAAAYMADEVRLGGRDRQVLVDRLMHLIGSVERAEQIAGGLACLKLTRRSAGEVVEVREEVYRRLFELWHGETEESVRMVARAAWNELPLLQRDRVILGSDTVKRFGDTAELSLNDGPEVKLAVLIAAYYFRAPWTDEELLRKVESLLVSEGPWLVGGRALYQALTGRDLGGES